MVPIERQVVRCIKVVLCDTLHHEVYTLCDWVWCKVSSVMLGPATIGEKNRGRSREEGGGGVEEKEGEKRRRGRGR